MQNLSLFAGTKTAGKTAFGAQSNPAGRGTLQITAFAAWQLFVQKQRNHRQCNHNGGKQHSLTAAFSSSAPTLTQPHALKGNPTSGQPTSTTRVVV